MLFHLGEADLGPAHPGDAGALVAQQELRVGPALILFSDKLIGRYPNILEEDLVDFAATVDRLDRPQRDARGRHVDEHKRNAGLALGRLRVGAHQAENPVRVLAQRRPRLLPVDDVAVAVADRGGAQGGEVRAGFGFGEALAPPDVDAGRRRQEALLDLLRSEFGDHRADHLDVEVQRLGDAGQLHFVGPDLVLGRCPVLAAPFDRPVRHREPVLVQDLVAGDDQVLRHRRALAHRLAEFLGDLGGVEGAEFFAERGFLGRERQLHGSLLSSGGVRGTRCG